MNQKVSVCWLSLLTGTAFFWFSSLAPDFGTVQTSLTRPIFLTLPRDRLFTVCDLVHVICEYVSGIASTLTTASGGAKISILGIPTYTNFFWIHRCPTMSLKFKSSVLFFILQTNSNTGQMKSGHYWTVGDWSGDLESYCPGRLGPGHLGSTSTPGQGRLYNFKDPWARR